MAGHRDHSVDLGVANGIATLDGSAQVPVSQLGNTPSVPSASGETTSSGFTGTGVNQAVTGLTFTMPAGTYIFTFSGSGRPQSNNSIQEMSIAVDGTIEAKSVRRCARANSANSHQGFTCRAKLTLTGGEVVTARLTANGFTGELFESTFDYVAVAA